jgi:DNA polymerase
MLIDFETRSLCDLRKAGAYRYAADPSTRVLMLGWGDGDDAQVWLPGEPFPPRVRDYADRAARGEAVFHAHNAAFERLIWNGPLRRLLPALPMLPPEAFDCTMARAAASGWPLSLDLLGKIISLPHQKDAAGAAALRIVSNGAKVYMPGQFEKVIEYCAQDIRTEAAALALLRPLSRDEREVWLLDQRINDRGVRLDVRSIHRIREVLAEARTRDTERLRRLTDGAVTEVSKIVPMREWINDRLRPTETLQGFVPQMHDMRAETVERFLTFPLPDDVRQVLQIRADAGGAAVKKLDAMLACVNEDGRARGLLQYHAANTGRWGGRLIQPQNFPRPGEGYKLVKDRVVDLFHEQDAETIDAWYPGGVYAAASDALRPLIMADEGHILRRADLSAIEARLVLWLAGHDDAMDVFRSGRCIYCEQASATYGRPIVRVKGQPDPPERQNGKIIVLGCGYQMGPARYIEHAATYGLAIDMEKAQKDVYSYRDRWWRVPEMWRAFERCAWRAYLDGGIQEYRGIQFAMQDGALCVRLHSGRILRWQGVHDEQEEDDQRPSLYAFRAAGGGWERVSLYGGLITERITQATARDVMVHGLRLAESEGLPVILSVHDEAVTEPRVDGPGLDVLVRCLSTTPSYLPGLPLAADGAEGPRYGK